MAMSVETGRFASTPPAQDRHNLIGSDRVEGTNVYRSEGTKIGGIERVMLEKVSGKVSYAVMSFGGFLGIGEDHYPIPWQRLTYNEHLGGIRNERHRPGAQERAEVRHRRGMEVGSCAGPPSL